MSTLEQIDAQLDNIPQDSLQEDPSANQQQGVNDEHPPSFYCPISCQIMHDPVMLEDGHTYERRHITKWLKTKNTSPKTGATLLSKKMYSNHALRNAISEYFQQIFSVHRRAIRKIALHPTPLREKAPSSFGSNAALLRCVDALMNASVLVTADLSTESVLRRIVDEARDLVGAEVASVFLVDEPNQQLFSTVNSTGSEIRIPIGAGIAGLVATSGESVLIADAYQDSRFNQAVDKETGFKTDSILCVPIKSKKGSVLGVAQLINKTLGGVVSEMSGDESAQSGAFTSADERFFSVFASQAAAAIANSGGSFDPEPSPGTSLFGSLNSKFVSLESDAVAEGKAADDEHGDLFKPGEKAHSKQEEKSELGASSAKSGGPAASKSLEAAGPPPALAKTVTIAEQSNVEAFAKETAKEAEGDGASERSSESSDSAEAEELSALLETAYRGFECDVLRLSELTHNAPLSTLGSFLFERSGLAAEFGLDRTKLHLFLNQVEKGYRDENPYHNKAHAASVLHMAHALMLHGGVAQTVGKGQWFSSATQTAAPSATAEEEGDDGSGQARAGEGARPVGSFETLAVLLAAACHDYDHPGVTNPFLVKSLDERAVRYNDFHPNENHHAAASFALLLDKEKQNGCDVLSHLNDKEFAPLRQLVVNLILGTDMADDKVIVGSVSAAIRSQEDSHAWGDERDSSDESAPLVGESLATNLTSKPTEGPQGVQDPSFEPSSKSEALASLQLALKAADIGHLALPWESHVAWVRRLEREFFAQGDMEKALGHSPVSFLMDRDKPGVSETQCGFFQFVVIPLFSALERAFPLCSPMVNAVDDNHEKWIAEAEARARAAAED